jgi:hypothetical protein
MAGEVGIDVNLPPKADGSGLGERLAEEKMRV